MHEKANYISFFNLELWWITLCITTSPNVMFVWTNGFKENPNTFHSQDKMNVASVWR